MFALSISDFNNICSSTAGIAETASHKYQAAEAVPSGKICLKSPEKKLNSNFLSMPNRIYFL